MNHLLLSFLFSIISDYSIYKLLYIYIHNNLLFPPDVRAVLTQLPVNTAVIAGSTATFYCTSSSNKIRWDYQRLGSSSPTTIWNGINKADNSQFRVNVTLCPREKSCALEVINVNLNDAGFASCFETGSNEFVSAALTVIGVLHNMCYRCVIMSQRVSAKLSVKDDIAFLWEHAVFMHSSNGNSWTDYYEIYPVR